MPTDVNCPYCGKGQEINHDDGYGYEEGQDYEQECRHCDRTFHFNTSISFSYQVSCQDGDHKLIPFGPKFPGMYECQRCDHYEKKQEDTDAH